MSGLIIASARFRDRHGPVRHGCYYACNLTIYVALDIGTKCRVLSEETMESRCNRLGKVRLEICSPMQSTVQYQDVNVSHFNH